MTVHRPVLTIVRSLAAASLLGSVGLIGYSGIAATHGPTVVEAAVTSSGHSGHDHDRHCCDHNGGGGEDNGGGDEGGDSGGKSAPATPKPVAGSTTTAAAKSAAKPMITTGSNGDLPFEGGLLLGGAGLGLLGAARRLREGR